MKNFKLLPLLPALIMVFGPYTTVQAEDKPANMTVYSEVDGYDDILRGKYQVAIDKMLSASGSNPMLIHNNLCVAYTLDRQFEQANTSCNRALSETNRRKNYGDTWLEQTGSSRTKTLFKSKARNHLAILESEVNQFAQK